MIDRRLLMCGTKEDLLAAGFKLGSDLQTGDIIYAIAITPKFLESNYESYSRQIVLQFGAKTRTCTYRYESYNFCLLFNADSNENKYYYFKMISNNNTSIQEAIYAWSGRMSGWKAGVGIQSGGSSGVSKVFQGIYVIHLFDAFSTTSGGPYNQYITYQGGTNTITDEVLFLTEPIVIDFD